MARLLVATVAATSATAPVMASNFHEISPYVVVGNPLTLAIIEFFAVPGALIGSLLYPLGLDRFVWHWVGWGIDLVLWAARLIAAAPGATLTVPAFAPWTLPCFALATCSAVIWRSPVLRLTALPLFALGLVGTRPAAALRPDRRADRRRRGLPEPRRGALAVPGKRNDFAAAQWLKADGDARDRRPGRTADGAPAQRCDAIACVANLPDGKTLSLVAKPEAFEEDCRRADVIVTAALCPGELRRRTDRRPRVAGRAPARSAFTGRNGALIGVPARATGENRPWSPAPTPRATRPAPRPPRVTASPDAAETDFDVEPDMTQSAAP